MEKKTEKFLERIFLNKKIDLLTIQNQNNFRACVKHKILTLNSYLCIYTFYHQQAKSRSSSN